MQKHCRVDLNADNNGGRNDHGVSLGIAHEPEMNGLPVQRVQSRPGRPNIGRPRQHAPRPRVIRRRPFGRFLIFYRIGGDSIEVLHVVEGARDYEPPMLPEK